MLERDGGYLVINKIVPKCTKIQSNIFDVKQMREGLVHMRLDVVNKSC